MMDQLFTGGGDGHALARAYEQGGPERFLEAAQGDGERGLRHPELRGRARQVGGSRTRGIGADGGGFFVFRN